MGFDVSKSTVRDFLKQGAFTIPAIQRRYSWGAEEAERLWKDIETFYEDEFQDFYLLHTVITVQENIQSRIHILDGQQRTTTILAMISAAIDVVEQHGQTMKFNFYISELEQLLRLRGESRLITTYDVDSEMLDWIQSAPNDRGQERKRSRVWKVYNFYRTSIFDEIMRDRGPEGGAKHILEVIYRGMLGDCFVTNAKFHRFDEAVTAFDTTNNRGKDLTLADLLRYFMLRKGQAPDKNIGGYIQQGWKQITEALDDNERNIKDFVVRFWCAKLGSRYQNTRLLRHLDNEINRGMMEKQDLIDLMDEMVRGAKLYHSLINPPTDDVNRLKLRLLRKAGASQHLTTLLAGKLRGLNDAEMGVLVNLTERVFFWYQIVGERAASALYNRYAEWAGQLLKSTSIHDGLTSLERSISDFLADHGLDETALERTFASLTVEKTAKVMFILAHLEFNDNPACELSDEDDMRVQHLAPPSANPTNWPGYSFDHQNEDVHHIIGNWLLFQATAPALPEDYHLKDLCGLAEVSTVQTTRKLSALDTWTIDDARARQTEMFKRCKEIWPIRAF